MKKVVLGFIMVLLTLLASPAGFAQNVSIWNGSSEIWTQGQGTESSPYLIGNAQQLAFIAEMVNGGVTHYDNTYFKLTTDVYIDSLTVWQPIGLNETYYFGGHFDGDNHTVTLYLTTSSMNFVGVFGYAQNGSISNLTSAGRVIRTAVPSSAYVGGICGYSTSPFSNCHNSGDIFTTVTSYSSHTSYSSYSGGICGYSTAAVINCHNTGDIFTANTTTTFSSSQPPFISSYSGGICGYSTAAVSNCHNTGDISTITTSSWYYSSSYSGGICGYSTAAVTNCYNTGGISSSSSNYSNISGYTFYSYSGGICGYSTSTVTKCYNTGAIYSSIYLSTAPYGTGTGYSSSSGGICGYSTAAVSNCHNAGGISSYTYSGSRSHSGGICGQCTNTNTNCYNTANISSSQSACGISEGSAKNCYNVGTLMGTTNYGIGLGTINNCHYLNTCGGTGDGTAKTEAQMKSSSFPVILNTDSVVFVIDGTPNINQGYPIFGSVTTLDAEDVGSTVATLKGNYQMLYDVDTHGFEYKKSNESNFTTVNTTGEGPVSYTVSGLDGGTVYNYRFFVQKGGVTYRGVDKTFNTVQCSLNGTVVSSTAALCEGDTVTYSITPTSTNVSSYQYVWSTGAHTNAISVTDDATYTVTVTDDFGCSIVRSKQMTLYPAAVAFITGSTVICGNNGTTLTANGGTYYSWNTGSAQRVISVSQPGIYIATVQTVYGCTASDTVEVVAFANPVINGNTVFCTGGYTTLTATGGDSYQWSTGATSASINVNNAGHYSVTASTSNGCSGSASVTVIQNQASAVTISGNTVICSGIGTSLTASPGTNYLWSTGETTQSISISNPGAYSVTVTNSNGCSNFATQTVSMMEQVTISGNDHFCSGQNTTLTASGSGSYAWSTGANTSSITVSTPGNYTVTVTLPNGCSSSGSTTVSVGTTPAVAISGSTTLCQNQNTTLTANGGVSYLWNNGSTNSNISVSQSGLYTVTATNAEGCSATANVTVTVNPLPNVSISGNSSFCQGDNVTLTATGANTYAWSNASTDAAITVSSAGNYTVTGTDANGCSNTATKTVSVNPTYNTPITYSICQGESYNFYGQNITAAGTYTHTLQTINGCDSVLTLVVTLEALPPTAITGNTTICEGESTTLTANGGVSYVWNNASTGNSINVTQSGVYTVTATNADGCSNTANVAVTVNPLPTITIGGNTTLCAGNSTTLTASGADSYSWSTGDNTASVSISAFGVYTVTGSTTAGCSGTTNVTVLVSQLPVITITGATDICVGESTTLTANGGTTYLWSNGITDATLTVSNAGTYQVIGYNAAGCNAMASATVNVWQPVTSEFTIECPDSCYIWNGESYCQSGDYTQTIQTIHGCDSVVTLHLTITVGVDDFDGFDFKVYPNPTSGIVNVQCTMNNVRVETVEIWLYDAYGKLVNVAAANNEGIAQIDLSRYAPGIYLIKAVADGNVVAVRKVVKR